MIQPVRLQQLPSTPAAPGTAVGAEVTAFLAVMAESGANPQTLAADLDQGPGSEPLDTDPLIPHQNATQPSPDAPVVASLPTGTMAIVTRPPPSDADTATPQPAAEDKASQRSESSLTSPKSPDPTQPPQVFSMAAMAFADLSAASQPAMPAQMPPSIATDDPSIPETPSMKSTVPTQQERPTVPQGKGIPVSAVTEPFGPQSLDPISGASPLPRANGDEVPARSAMPHPQVTGAQFSSMGDRAEPRSSLAFRPPLAESEAATAAVPAAPARVPWPGFSHADLLQEAGKRQVENVSDKAQIIPSPNQSPAPPAAARTPALLIPDSGLDPLLPPRTRESTNMEDAALPPNESVRRPLPVAAVPPSAMQADHDLSLLRVQVFALPFPQASAQSETPRDPNATQFAGPIPAVALPSPASEVSPFAHVQSGTEPATTPEPAFRTARIWAETAAMPSSPALERSFGAPAPGPLSGPAPPSRMFTPNTDSTAGSFAPQALPAAIDIGSVYGTAMAGNPLFVTNIAEIYVYPQPLVADASPFAPIPAELPRPHAPDSATPSRPSISPMPLTEEILRLVQIAPDGPVTLTLRPDDLGTLRFEVKQTDQGLHIHLAVDEPQTLDLLRRQGDQVLADLRQAGFAGASLSFAGGGGQDAPSQHSAPSPAAAGPSSPPPAADQRPPPPRPNASPGTLDLRL